MAYLLNGTTLPRPINLERRQIEISRKLNMLNGATKKDIVGRKEQFVLSYEKLSQSDVATIIAIYNLNSEVTFEVTESSLTVAQTTVHVEIPTRAYTTKGTDYREDLTLVLTEVT